MNKIKILYTIPNFKTAGSGKVCLLYTSDAADDSLRVDLGGRRIIKKRVLIMWLINM